MSVLTFRQLRFLEMSWQARTRAFVWADGFDLAGIMGVLG